MEKKRERSANFSAAEEELLIKCVLLRKAVLECKKTDACTVNEKKSAWEDVAVDFNSRCPNMVARSAKALREKYGNSKAKLRKKFAAEKASRKATGGGKSMPEWQPSSDAMLELAQTIEMSISGTTPNCDDDDDNGGSSEIQNSFADLVGNVILSDNDADVEEAPPVIEPDVEEAPPAIEPEVEEPPPVNPLTQASAKKSAAPNWSEYSPRMLKKPVSTALKRSASRSIMAKNESSADLKIKMIRREMEMREEEHAEHVLQKKAEHNAKMEVFAAQLVELREKSELRRKRFLMLKKRNNISDSESESE